MDRIALSIALSSAGLYHGRWKLDDVEYDPLSAKFVLQAFEDWVASLPDVLKERCELGGGKSRIVPRYLPEVFDCDNHAKSFANFLDEACAVDAATSGNKRGNPAAGVFNFNLETLEGLKGHARNWIVDYGIFVLTFDPGIGEFSTQSPTELASVSEGETI